MATFIDKISSKEFQDLPLRKPKFTPNGRPITQEKQKLSRPHTGTSMYFIQKPKGGQYLSLHECIESRPPMTGSLTGPSPQTYTPKQLKSNANCIITPKSLNEEQVAVGSTDLWTHTLSARKNKKPSPNSYFADNVFGMFQPVRPEAPAYSIGVKHKPITLARPGAEKEPAPNSYHFHSSSRFLYPTPPCYSMGPRRSSDKALTPGPAMYSPNYSYLHSQSPSYTMLGRSKDK